MKRIFLIVMMVFVSLGFVYADDWAPPNTHPLSESTVLVAEIFGGMGTGVILTEDGYILTAAHVVSGPGALPLVVQPDGYPHKARVVSWNVDKDWALLKIDLPKGFKPLKPVKIGNLDKMMVGDEVFTMGHPYGIAWMMAKGILSGVKYDSNGYQYIYTDASGAPGSSGSGIYNDKFELIGIVQRGETGVGHFGVGGNAMVRLVTIMIDQDRLQEPMRQYLKKQSERAKKAWKQLLGPEGEDE